MRVSTSSVLSALEALLEAAVPAAGVTLDVCARFDGAPAEAVDEHVVELRGAAGTSVLVGYLTDDDVDEDEEALALGATLRAGVIVVVRRSRRAEQGEEPSQSEDARQLDGLYDAALDALRDGRDALAPLSCGRIRILRGQALQGADDWFGRVIPVQFTRPLD